MSRQLAVMRHAKAAHAPGLGDRERPLDPRGRQEAAEAGAWLLAELGTVDHVLCSTAARTRETLQFSGIVAPTEFSSDIYGGWTDDLLDQIHLVDDRVDTLLLIGHSPVLGQLVLGLADSANEPAALVRQRFPTSAVAILTCHQPWRELRYAGATVTSFRLPS